jgi:hypothetical protein
VACGKVPWPSIDYRRGVLKLSRAALLTCLIGAMLVLAACDAESDLRAYFGSPLPSPAGPGRTEPPASPQPTATAIATPTASPTPTPPPTARPEPTPAQSPTASPAGGPTISPSPTRPPNLPPMGELRAQAAEVSPERLAANPGRFLGELLFFDGRVLSVREDGNGVFRARIRTGAGIVQLTYEADSYWGQPLVPQDRIRVVGYFRGLADASGDEGRVPVIEVYDLLVRFT